MEQFEDTKDNYILIKITDDVDQLIEHGQALVDQIVNECNVDNDLHKLICITYSNDVHGIFYAIVSNNECIAKLLREGKITCMSSDEYEQILINSPDIVSDVFIEDDGASNQCIIL